MLEHGGPVPASAPAAGQRRPGGRPPARLGWLDELHTPSARMWFAATAAHVLDRAAVVGLALAEVDGRPVADVAADLRRTADGIAAAFDALRVDSGLRGAGGRSRRRAGARRPTLPPTAAASHRGGRAVARPPPSRRRTSSSRRMPCGPPSSRSTRAWRTWWGRGCASATGSCPSRRRRSGRPCRSSTGSARRMPGPSATAPCSTAPSTPPGAPGTRPGPCGARASWRSSRSPRARPATPDRRAGPRRRRPCRGRPRSRGRASPGGGPRAGRGSGMWRRVAWFGIPDDPAGDIARAAAAYGTAGLHRRRLLCEVESAMALAPSDPAAASARLDATEPEVTDVPVLRAMLLDVRSRLARAAGDDDAGLAHVREALAVRGLPDRARLPCCSACARCSSSAPTTSSSSPAADLVAAATRLRDPALLAHGQRFLGLAYVETGRPGRGSRAARGRAPGAARAHPCPRRPGRLGSRQRARRTRPVARRAHGLATAATAFEAEGASESAHAQWRAGTSAWDAGDVDARRATSTPLIQQARASTTVDLCDPPLTRGAAGRHRGPRGPGSPARRRDPRGPAARAGRRRRGRVRRRGA